MKTLNRFATCLLIVLASNLVVADVCVSKTFQFCQILFNQNLNVSSESVDWVSPSTLSFIIRSYYLQGIDGLLSVCNARQQFAQCLGSQYDSCMSELNFINNGQSPNNAAQFVQIFKTTEFDCDGGFIQSSRHWPCIALVLQANNDDLNACQQKYQDKLKANPSQICSLADDYDSCVRQYFSKSCGAEASWWSCERTRRGFSFDKKCPSSACDFSGSHVQLSRSESERSQESGAERVFNRVSDVGKVLQSLAQRQK